MGRNRKYFCFCRTVENLNLMFAYTYTESKEISGMPGSNAASAYNGLIQIQWPASANDVQRSQFVVPSKAIASASYRIPYANDHMATTVNLFYSGFLLMDIASLMKTI
jgi:hypothetical protein